MKKPPSWTDKYPHGTAEGDEEFKFFVALSRHPRYKWRSTSALSKESGLTKERIEEIIVKYWKKGMIFQSPTNDDQWAYWERVPDMLPTTVKSLSDKDHDDRIKRLNADKAFDCVSTDPNALCQPDLKDSIVMEDAMVIYRQWWSK